MGDDELRQPMSLEMEHCASTSVLHNLRIIRAADSNKFEYLPGGKFTSVQRYGVIRLQTFSRFAIFLRNLLPFRRPSIEYSANIAYTKISYLQFHFLFFIIKNMSVWAKVSG
jgi:hypothetical protein